MAKYQPKKNKRGRPSKRTPEIEDVILKGIADGESLRKVCAEAKIEPSTFFDWIQADDGFHKRYARAKEIAAELMADEILNIADDSSEDEMFIEADDESGKGAKRVQNSEFINRSRLRVDSRKWLLSKLLPKKYGEKIGVEHSASGSVMAAVAAHLSGEGREK